MNLEEHIRAGGTHDLATDDRGRVRCGCGVWGDPCRFMVDPPRCPNCWGKEYRAAKAVMTALASVGRPPDWRGARRREYARLDALLLEALAEQAEGRPGKMADYLAARAKVKADHPKPETPE